MPIPFEMLAVQFALLPKNARADSKNKKRPPCKGGLLFVSGYGMGKPVPLFAFRFDLGAALGLGLGSGAFLDARCARAQDPELGYRGFAVRWNLHQAFGGAFFHTGRAVHAQEGIIIPLACFCVHRNGFCGAYPGA